MKIRFRFSRTVALVFILLAPLVLLLACFSYFHWFWPIQDILSVGVPILGILDVLALVIALFYRRRMALLPTLALLVSLLCFEPWFKFGSPARVDVPDLASSPATGDAAHGPSKGRDEFRILSFNVGNFYFLSRSEEGSGDAGPSEHLAAFLGREGARIVCFQELERSYFRGIPGYPYRHFTPEIVGKSTQAILSDYPIVGTGTIDFEGSANNAIYADIALPADTIRVYNIHLQSYRIRSRRFLYGQYGKRFLWRFASVAAQHLEQAGLVRAHMLESPYAPIICGDFNATAFSNTYRVLKQGMQDSFSEQGSGLGTSYYLKGLPYRIDYILADPAFRVTGHHNYPFRLSDHFPVAADLQIQSQ